MIKDEVTGVQRAFKDLFSTPEGKVVLQHLFISLKMGESTFVSGDPYTSAYNEGKRSVYVEIIRNMELDLTPFFKNSINRRQERYERNGSDTRNSF